MRRLIVAVLSTAAAYTPIPAIEFSDRSPGVAPAITSTLTQPGGESASRTIRAKFPPEFTYNPDFSVVGCNPADEAAAACAEESKLGTFDATSPLGNATGPLHLMTDLRLVAFVTSYLGLYQQRIVGKIFVGDGGGAEVVFDNLPDVPVTSSSIALEGGTRGSLVNPRRCGTYEILSRLESHQGEVVERALPVQIEGCPTPLVVRRPRHAAGVLRWELSEPARTEVILLRREGRTWSELRRWRVAGTSLRLPAGLAGGRYRAILRAATGGRASPARRVTFRR